MPDKGHIELERQIDSITVGVRHRRDLGDMSALMRSIEEVGLLQPITVTPDGVLVCGLRRLEAMRRLGKRTLSVWVRSWGSRKRFDTPSTTTAGAVSGASDTRGRVPPRGSAPAPRHADFPGWRRAPAGLSLALRPPGHRAAGGVHGD